MNEQVKENEMDMACSTHGAKRNACKVMVGEAEGMGPLGRPKHRWEDNIKMDLGEIGGMVWTGFILLRIWTSEHRNEPSGSTKCWDILEYLSV
jgi:hypothetical protein